MAFGQGRYWKFRHKELLATQRGRAVLNPMNCEQTSYVDDQRECFDRVIMQDWDSYLNPSWDKTRRFEVGRLLRLVSTPRRVLDVGCGSGYHDLLFAESPSIEQVIGIDSSPKSIEQATRHYSHPKVERYIADVFDQEWLVRRFGRFDLVVSFQVIEHLSRPVAFLGACFECTRDGGYVGVVTPNRNRVQNRLRVLLRRKPEVLDSLHYAEYNAEELVSMGQQKHLTFVGLFGCNFYLSLKGITLVGSKTPFSRTLGSWLPGLAHTVGIVFQKRPEGS